MIGSRLLHYEITGKLGEGGMGEVYLAEDTRLGRQVALKILPPEKSASQERLERFQREARALAALDHPNIVTIHSIDEDAGRRFLTMALAEGKSLGERIPPSGMRLAEVFSIAIQIADALAAAHEKGITHRDLKPANVMVADDGRVKVLDFGLAKLFEPEAVVSESSQDPTRVLTQEGLAVGTVPYMSPEQIEGKGVDHRSDIFSMGVLLYEMVTGHRPFTGDTSASLMSSILKDEPTSVLEIKDDIPRHLGRIVQHCLEKDPELRYQSAKDLRNELAGLQREVESGQVEMHSSSSVVAARRARSSRMPLYVASGAVVVLLAGWLVLGRRDTTSQAPSAGAAASTPATAAAERKMTVVLPFENLGNAEDEYFASGMTEEITSRLAVVDGLGVISRKSASSYAGTDKSTQQIGRELGVDYILEGTVRWARQGDGTSRVRVTPQLIQVSDDTTVWSQSYDREIDDIFEIQEEIASRVAEEMGFTLLAGRGGAEEQPTENIEAYHAYLKGRTYLDSPADLERDTPLAIESFQRAVRLDPKFRQGWSALSQAQAKMVHYSYDRSDERRSLAKEAADRAAALDASAPDVELAYGYYYYWGRREYGPALEHFDRALAMRPADPDLLTAKAFVLRRMGRQYWPQSLELLQRADQLNPRDASLVYEIASDLAQNRRYTEAVEMADRLIALVPDETVGYWTKANAILQWKGNVPEVRENVELAPLTDTPGDIATWWLQEMRDGRYRDALGRLEPLAPEGWENQIGVMPKALAIGLTWEAMGDERSSAAALEEARTDLSKRLEAAPEDPRLHMALARAEAGLGHADVAVGEAERAVDLYHARDEPLQGPQYLTDLAEIYMRAGRIEQAIDLLDELLAIPSTISLPMLRTLPLWAPLRADPGFAALEAKYD